MRQPNRAPLTRRSTMASARSASGRRVNGKYGGWNLRPGVSPGMRLLGRCKRVILHPHPAPCGSGRGGRVPNSRPGRPEPISEQEYCVQGRGSRPEADHGRSHHPVVRRRDRACPTRGEGPRACHHPVRRRRDRRVAQPHEGRDGDRPDGRLRHRDSRGARVAAPRHHPPDDAGRGPLRGGGPRLDQRDVRGRRPGGPPDAGAGQQGGDWRPHPQVRDAGHDRPGLPVAHRPDDPPRRAHRPADQAVAVPCARDGADQDRAVPPPALGPDDGPRSLQAGQRHVRPPGGVALPLGSRRAHPRGDAGDGCERALWRGRVRVVPARDRHGGRAGRGGADPGDAGGAFVPVSTRRATRCASRSASRPTPPTGTSWKAWCTRQTPRCTGQRRSVGIGARCSSRPRLLDLLHQRADRRLELLVLALDRHVVLVHHLDVRLGLLVLEVPAGGRCP